MNAFSDLDNYRQWQWIWTPFSPTQSGLFLVRYPGDLLQITRARYKALVKLRVQNLIYHWMHQTKRGQPETHRLLTETWQILDALHKPPQLGDLWVWQQEWADALIDLNTTFFKKLALRMEYDFPARMYPPIPSEQQQLRTYYQNMMLVDWLGELTGERL